MPLVAFRVGSVPFYTYTLLVDLGLLVATAGLTLEGRRRGWSAAAIFEVLVWALVPGLAIGRAVYAASLGLPPWQLQPWGDGFSFAAALAGGAAGLAVLAALRRQSYWPLVGSAVPGLALGQALGWLGAAAHGVAAGIVQPPAAWWAPRLRDVYGVELARFPVQYLAALLSLAAWATMHRWRLRDGGRAACYALLTGLGLALLAGQMERNLPLLAASGQPVAAGLSLDQVLYLALGLAGLAMLAVGLRRRIAGKKAG